MEFLYNKQDIPDFILNEVKLWKIGNKESFPESYIKFHYEQALKHLSVIENNNYSIINKELVPDEKFLDELYLLVKAKSKDNNKISLFKWSSSQCWFEKKENSWKLAFIKPTKYVPINNLLSKNKLKSSLIKGVYINNY